MPLLVAGSVSCTLRAQSGSAVPCLGIFMAHVLRFVLSAPLFGGMCYLMCCALCVPTMLYMLLSWPSILSGGISRCALRSGCFTPLADVFVTVCLGGVFCL